MIFQIRFTYKGTLIYQIRFTMTRVYVSTLISTSQLSMSYNIVVRCQR